MTMDVIETNLLDPIDGGCYQQTKIKGLILMFVDVIKNTNRGLDLVVCGCDKKHM